MTEVKQSMHSGGTEEDLYNYIIVALEPLKIFVEDHLAERDALIAGSLMDTAAERISETFAIMEGTMGRVKLTWVEREQACIPAGQPVFARLVKGCPAPSFQEAFSSNPLAGQE